MKRTLLLFLLLPVLSFAQIVDLVKWDATLSANRNTPTYVNTLYPTSVVADVISSGAGALNYNTDNASQPYFSIGGWPNPQQNEGSYDTGKYIEFKITPKTGNKIDLSSFSFSQRSQGNTQKFQIQYSTDDTFKSNVKVLVPETISTTTWATVTSSFSPELNPVLAGQVVYIRVYVYSSNDNFHFKIIDTPAKITGSVSGFDSSKILAINDYVTTTKEVGINISPLNNDVKKENVTSITISTPALASQGSAILNPDKTITFNPAKNFTGKATFKYTISNAGNPSSEGTVEVNVSNLVPETLVIWNAKSSDRPKPSVNSPYVTAANVTSNGGISDVGNGYNNNEDSNNPFYSTSGWPNTQYNGGTLDPTRYLEFKMTAEANHKIDLSTFGFIYRTTGGTTQRIKISYSKSSTPNTNDKVLLADSVTPTNWTTINSAFSSDLNTLSAGDTVYIRVYVYNTYDPFQFRTKTAINGSIRDTNTLLANNDDVSTPINQPAKVVILSNDVIGNSPVQEITVTQPTNGNVTVNTDNSLTFTPSSTFTGTTSFTYTLRNANSNYSSATVGVLGTAAVCTASSIAGDNYWKGYVYTYTGNNPGAATYVGSVAEKAIFDRNVGDGVITGDASIEANAFCGTVPSDKFFIKYLMKATTAIGTYNITFGADDGVRLYIDGTLVPVTPTNSWSDHSYVTYFAQYNFTTAGPHDFVLEYYENGGSSRVSFSYGLVKGDPTVYGTNVWNVYGYTAPNFNLPAVNYAGTYVDSKLDINTTSYWAKEKSPSSSVIWEGAPMPIDNFTISYKRQGFPCGSYNIQVVNCDDDMQIYIDGALVYTAGANINAPVVISGGPYKLKSDSKVEIRLREDGGDAKMAVNFIDVPVVYSGSGTVAANTSIIVKANATLNSSIEVCSCTIDPGKTLTIPLDKVLTVKENITVGTGGKLSVQNGGSLLQTNKNAIYTGTTDSFELQRITQPMRYYDFTYWSSPVTLASGYTLKKLSPDTAASMYQSYNPFTGWVSHMNGAASMIPGVGYIVRSPETSSATVGTAYSALFVGVPNNGDINFTPIENKYNLIGNPYPSPLDAAEFIKKNNGNTTGSLYFWTHNTAPANTDPTKPNIYAYTSNDYAVFNLTGSVATGYVATGTEAPSDKSPANNAPNGKIASGQGFFVKVLTNTPLKFTNEMRSSGSNSQFLKTSGSNADEGRLWLNFTNSQGAFKQTLVGYIDEATNNFENNYDAQSYNANAFVDFYSINDNKKLVIQGRALPFEMTDQIPLGYKSAIAGDFKISIDHVDGSLKEQAIFLEDKTTGIIHDLRTSDYTFKTEIGTFTERFVLRYKTDKTLGTGDFENIKDGILVSVNNKVINVATSKENIKEVTVFDLLGKMLYNKKKIGNTELQIQNLQSGNQLLLVKVTLENDFTVSKKIIFN